MQHRSSARGSGCIPEGMVVPSDWSFKHSGGRHFVDNREAAARFLDFSSGDPSLSPVAADRQVRTSEASYETLHPDLEVEIVLEDQQVDRDDVLDCNLDLASEAIYLHVVLCQPDIVALRSFQDR
jgi:hypothetical protein